LPFSRVHLSSEFDGGHEVVVVFDAQHADVANAAGEPLPEFFSSALLSFFYRFPDTR
jgi:hypothetical protein